jgi:type II secretory pathway component PulF
MNRFLYTAKDRSGQDVSGAVVAHTQELALAQLQEAGYFVTGIQPALRVPPPRPASGLQRAFHGVHSGDLAIMFRELATMVGAGMSLVRSLDVLEQNTAKSHLRAAIRDMQQAVESGQPLSVQLRRHDAIFPEIAAATVEAAERSGRLDEMFKMLAAYMEYEHEIRQTVRRETVYPKIVAAVVVLVLILLAGLSVWRGGGSCFHCACSTRPRTPARCGTG